MTIYSDSGEHIKENPASKDFHPLVATHTNTTTKNKSKPSSPVMQMFSPDQMVSEMKPRNKVGLLSGELIKEPIAWLSGEKKTKKHEKNMSVCNTYIYTHTHIYTPSCGSDIKRIK